MSELSTGDVADNATMLRSALRHTVRLTWAWADALQPPGRMNDFKGGSIVSMAAISVSRRLTSQAGTAGVSH